jgi:Cu/Ag efflux pump CusA
MMIIAGLMVALGAMIDDAIIDVENIVRRFRRSRWEDGGKSTSTTIFNAILAVRSPLLYATVIMVLALVPALFLEGVSGAFWQPLATTYMLALAASFVAALAITPALSLIFLRKTSLQTGDSPVMGMLRGLYNGLWLGSTPHARPLLPSALSSWLALSPFPCSARNRCCRTSKKRICWCAGKAAPALRIRR